MVKSAPFSSIALRHYDKPINYLLRSSIFSFRKSMKIPKRKDASPFSFDFQQNTFLSVIYSNFHLQKTAKRHKRKRQRIKRGEKGKERERERLGRFSSFEGKRLFIATRRTILEREGFRGGESVRSSRDLGRGEGGRVSTLERPSRTKSRYETDTGTIDSHRKFNDRVKRRFGEHEAETVARIVRDKNRLEIDFGSAAINAVDRWIRCEFNYRDKRDKWSLNNPWKRIFIFGQWSDRSVIPPNPYRGILISARENILPFRFVCHNSTK